MTMALAIRVVNIAVLVLLPIASAILSEYWRKYQRYFSYAVLRWVLAILFQVFFVNIWYQYFCRQVH